MKLYKRNRGGDEAKFVDSGVDDGAGDGLPAAPQAAIVETGTSTLVNTAPVMPSFTATPTTTGTGTSKPTSTRIPTLTPKPTKTASITPTPTAYPTFILSDVQTHTPPAPAQCPVENPDMRLTAEIPEPSHHKDYIELIQNLLNEGSSFRQVFQANDSYKSFSLKMHDLTGDGIEEFVVIFSLQVVIFECDSGEYKIMKTPDYTELASFPPWIVDIQDMNLNGTPDMVLKYYVTSGMNTGVNILEWDGEQFVNLIQSDHGEDSETISRLARTLYWYPEYDLRNGSNPLMNGHADIEIKDIDRNGTKELILTDDGPGHPDTFYSHGPWRGKRVVFSWDGIHFLFSDLEMDPPEYRFQAVQDADRYFLLGRYDEALALYHEANFNKALDWWTQQHMDYILRLKAGFLTEDDSVPEPDPDEYQYLAAYARYRIMLHHVARGWRSDAEVVYNTLQQKFPAGTAGHEFAEAATLFWDEYNATEEMDTACTPVIAYVRDNQDLFYWLGNSGMREQSHQYEPEDICSFP